MNEYHMTAGAATAYRRMRSFNHGLYGTVPTDVPAPAYPHDAVRRTKSSIPVRVYRRLTSKSSETYDPNTIPVLSKKEQRKIEKREQKKLEELRTYQRKQFHDQISRQLEVNQSTRDQQHFEPTRRRTVKDKVKTTLRLTKKSKRAKTQLAPPCATLPTPTPPPNPPHIDDFHTKNDLRSWFQPSDVEAVPPPAATILDDPPAELPATDVYHDWSTGLLKKQPFDDRIDLENLPPPIRSPSPCLSSAAPRRNITISETPTYSPTKQMQCDYCHGAIKLTGYHYACNLCNDGDCIYCANCANDGRTCRHELIECTRNIKRHPTNPQSSDRRQWSPEKDRESVVFSDLSAQSIELSTTVDTRAPEVVTDDLPSSSGTRPDSQPSPISPAAEDFFREFENRRREQDMTLREQAVVLREREAMLREREIVAASRERDAALVQQLHAAAMLQQGSQFSPRSPNSRQSSCCAGPSSRHSSHPGSSARSWPNSPASTRSRSSSIPISDGVTLHAEEKGKRPNIELVSSAADIEASIAGIEESQAGIRSHTNSSKRKAGSSARATGRSSNNNSRTNSSRRLPPRKYEEADDDDDDDESDDSDTSSHKRLKPDQPAGKQLFFACPYYKHDPIRYAEGNTDETSYRKCAGGLYRDISRIKQHLKRKHHRPNFYCRRCFGEFKSNDKLQKHCSSLQGCNARECPYPELLDETQQSRIHVKRPGKNPKELWFEIFSICFPDAPFPDSPYVEKTGPPDMLIHFIELFNQRLDFAAQSRPWLASNSTRDFLNGQIEQALQELQMTSSRASSMGVPSLLVSPVSPPDNLSSRQSSTSSHQSSSVLPSAPRNIPQQAAGDTIKKPILKVATSDTHRSATSVRSSPGSGFQQNNLFPQVPRHVQEDSGFWRNGQSWASGDDIPMMSEAQSIEPSSATSTHSTKSVSFAPPPMQWTPFTDPHPKASTLADIAGLDWSARVFPEEPQPTSQPYQHISYQSQLQPHPRSSHSSFSSQTSQKRPANRPRADSAYGTMSSAQASRQTSHSSLYQPQAQQQQPKTPLINTTTTTDDAFYNPHQNLEPHDAEQLTCVDPQMLFKNPVDGSMSPGLSADVQAYFNRNRGQNGYY